METDTDSLYIAISQDTIEECLRSDKLKDWNKRRNDYFASDREECMTFEGKEISKKQYEKGTTEKFKLELVGVGMVFLNSKVYHILTLEAKSKILSMGMQKCNNIKEKDFPDVLLNKVDHRIQNDGFINDGLHKSTYTQTKKGLNYFYCKRLVLDDGINTTHLEYNF